MFTLISSIVSFLIGVALGLLVGKKNPGLADLEAQEIKKL